MTNKRKKIIIKKYLIILVVPSINLEEKLQESKTLFTFTLGLDEIKAGFARTWIPSIYFLRIYKNIKCICFSFFQKIFRVYENLDVVNRTCHSKTKGSL